MIGLHCSETANGKGNMWTMDEVCDRIRQDYANFPKHQSYELYAESVYFQDPLNRFTGVERYRQMIHFIDRWFRSPQLELHGLTPTSPQTFETRWTLRWVAPLPWQPALAINGWTEYQLNDAGQIITHIDHWDTPPLSVLGQLFTASTGGDR